LTRHPYQSLGATHFWSRSVAAPGAHEIDPMVGSPFAITRDDRVGTMGSCFAQHLSRFLQRSGLNYFVSEEGDATKGYGVFSARYGNVYTVRQAVQLFDRAYGQWTPVVSAWARGDRFVDPFRPQVDPTGFASEGDLASDRTAHLGAVRRVFEESSVLVFTLGLTEGWRDRRDGAVYPVVPGAAGGQFDPEQHEFTNFTVTEVVDDLLAFIDRVRGVNPGIRFLLTVSPVPLIATYTDAHVLAATTYSKSVLRVAAAEAERARDGVVYFPSYEVITSPAAGNLYFEDDLRSVSERGVAHVMRVFSAHFLEAPPAPVSDEEVDDRIAAEFRRTAQVVCDEEVLDAG
jgi:hypothetical protein